MSLTVVVLTKDEEKNILNLLKSVSFADEIIIIDDKSIDKTIEIAKKAGAKVYLRELLGDFAKQKNYGLEKATSKWVLFLDADEVVPKELAEEIVQTLNNSYIHAEGFYIKRKDFLWGAEMKHGEVGNTRSLRLIQKHLGKWIRPVHEELSIRGRVKTLKYPLYHYPHQTIREFVDHVNNWSTLHAEANRKEGKRASLFKIIFWPLGSFVVNYFFRLGFMDGLRGFELALMMSLHSFLSWSKQSWK